MTSESQRDISLPDHQILTLGMTLRDQTETLGRYHRQNLCFRSDGAASDVAATVKSLLSHTFLSL